MQEKFFKFTHALKRGLVLSVLTLSNYFSGWRMSAVCKIDFARMAWLISDLNIGFIPSAQLPAYIRTNSDNTC